MSRMPVPQLNKPKAEPTSSESFVQYHQESSSQKSLILSTNEQINSFIDGFQCKLVHKLDNLKKQENA